MKYKYGNIENAKPGDVVESIGSDHNTTAGKLYIIQEGSSNSSIGHFISDSGEKTDGICLAANFWKLILTKTRVPRKGDTTIVIATGEIHNYIADGTHWLNDLIVLCEEEEEEEEKSISEEQVDTYKPKYVVGDSIQTDYNWYKDSIVKIIEIYTGDNDKLCYKYDLNTDGKPGGVDYCYIVDQKSKYYKIDTLSQAIEVGDLVRYIGPRDTTTEIKRPDTCIVVKLFGNMLRYEKHSACDVKHWELVTKKNDLGTTNWVDSDAVKAAATWYTPAQDVEVKVYDYALAKEEIEKIYEQQESPLYMAFNTKVKGDLMDHNNNITISMTAKEFAKYEKENKPETPKTELERASKTVTKWYNENGHCYNQTGETKKKASKALQHPTKLGHTFRTYTISASETTAIPTVNAL